MFRTGKRSSPGRNVAGAWAVLLALLTFLCTAAFSQTLPPEPGAVKVFEFFDGTTVTGKMVEMNIDTVRIETKEGPVITRKFKDIKYVYDEQEYVRIQKPLTFFPTHAWELGTEVSWIKYEEPDFMEEKGPMVGIVGSYTYHRYFMVKLEGKFAYGEVDYSSPRSGELDGIEDYLFEFRALLGYDYPAGQRLVITPYFGVGYRYLNDDSGGKATTTGARGYERESQYYYTPIGVSGVFRAEGGWLLGVTLEYDYFWSGKQKSHLGDAVAGLPTLENDQDDGYGLRGSVMVRKRFETVTLNVEPYIRYWNIDRSDVAIFSYGDLLLGGYEPDNESTEIGCRLSLVF